MWKYLMKQAKKVQKKQTRHGRCILSMKKPASNSGEWMLVAVVLGLALCLIGVYFALISRSRRSAWPHLSII